MIVTPTPNDSSSGRASGNEDDPEAACVETAEDLGTLKQLRLDAWPSRPRRQADAEGQLVAALERCGFDPRSPEWRTLRDRLAARAYPVLVGWGISGRLRAKAAEHANGRGVLGLGKVPESLGCLQPDDAESLAQEILLVALDAFLTKSLQNRHQPWDPNGGASLETYFIGRCLQELPAAYVRWHRNEGQSFHYESIRDDGRYCSSPDDAAEAGVEVARFLHGATPLTLAMIELKAADLTDAAIAATLTAVGHPTSESKVRTDLYRLRQTARTERRKLDG